MSNDIVSRTLTMADLCQAIENGELAGELAADQKGQFYVLKRREIVRYACHVAFTKHQVNLPIAS